MAISKRMRWRVLQRDNYTCRYCGAFAPLAVLVLDHVTPKAAGGLDVMENLVTACDICNSGKSDALPEPSLVDEVKRAAADWPRKPPPPEPDEDELADAERYRDALRLMDTLPAEDVLRWIVAMYQAADPYRPTFRELVIAAGGNARHERASLF